MRIWGSVTAIDEFASGQLELNEKAIPEANRVPQLSGGAVNQVRRIDG
jgi:hypothetical protein